MPRMNRITGLLCKAGNVFCSLAGAAGIFVSAGLSAQGDVLCVAGPRAAVEMAADGHCSPPPQGNPAVEALTLVAAHSGSSGCGACVDIPLGKNLSAPPSPSKHSGAHAAPVLADRVSWSARMAAHCGPLKNEPDAWATHCALLRMPVLRI